MTRLSACRQIPDAGGAIVEILGTYGFVAAPTPTKAELDSWITTYNLTCSTFIDAPGHTSQTINLFNIRETMIIVDVSTMKIKSLIHGNVAGIGPSSVGQATTTILNCLQNGC